MKPECYMLTSAFLYSLQNLFIKLSSNHNNIGIIGMIRGIIGILLFIPNFIYKKKFPKIDKHIGLFSTVSTISLLTQFYALRYIPISISTTIQAISPIWTGIFCYISGRRDDWHYLDMIGSLICFTGILLLTHHNDQNHNILGILLSLCSSISTGGINIMMYDIDHDKIDVYLFYSMVILSLTSFFLISYDFIHLDDYYLYLMGLSSVLAVIFKTVSLQMSKKIGIILLRYMDIFFSILWEIFILSRRLDRDEYIFIMMIIIGCMIRKY